MSKKIFTEKEVKILSRNPYVKSVSSKGITYTDEFKHLFIEENAGGIPPREIFEKCGFDIEVLGMHRVRAAGKRWRAIYRENGIAGLRDTRTENSGRPCESEFTLEEKYARLEAKFKLLKAENELLKKIRYAERGMKRKQ